jgi:NitT/TauT family transport system substrate-binding protein
MRSIMAGMAAVVGGALLVAGCSSGGSSSSSASSAAGAGSASAAAAPVTLRLGYLANITHAPALIAVKNGYFTKELGSAGTVKTTVFTSGTQETTAILAGQIDAAYVGPNPAINAWQQSGGSAIKVISGVATGGASVVVKPAITSAAQLKGQSLATPSLGNTQDVAVRYWLKQNGLTTSTTGGGDVSIKPTTPNSAAVLEYKSGQIAGASEPSPYDVEIVQDGGKVLLSEPGVSTVLMVTQSFLNAHPAIVADLLKANLDALNFIKSNPAQAQAAANDELAAYTASRCRPR